MKRSYRSFLFTEFAVLGGFLIVCVIGYFAAMVAMVWPASTKSSNGLELSGQPAQVAPSVTEYRETTAAVVGPLFAQVVVVREADFAKDKEAMATLAVLVDKTQERLLRVRVPQEERDTHLAVVLLLEQWRRALAGSKSDMKAAAPNTKRLIAAHPWLLP